MNKLTEGNSAFSFSSGDANRFTPITEIGRLLLLSACPFAPLFS